MSQPPASPPPEPPPGPPPYYPPPMPGHHPPAGNSKTISVLALVFGGLALLFSLIPVAGIFIGGLFGIAAIVLGIIGIFKSHKLFAIIGIALAVVGLIVAVIITVAVGRTADEIIEDWPTDYGDSSGEDEGHGDAPQDQAVDGTDPTAPLPAGTEVDTGTWKVSFSDVAPDATDTILAEDDYNTPPAEGQQYFMFQVDAAYEGEDASNPWDDLAFGVYFNNTLYASYSSFDCGYLPNDLSEAPMVYSGGTASGNVCVVVATDGVEGAVISVEDYWNSGQRYFVAAS
jgi:hypothetical protein